MRLARLLSTLILGLTVTSFAACGGDDGGTPDAFVYMDAKVFMDAPPGKTGLGNLCSQAMPCGTEAPLCIALGMGKPSWCSAVCGQSAGSDMPPAGGQAVCDEFMSTPGTPLCAVVRPPSGNETQYTWACGVYCGTFMGMELGTCPTGLTCTSNLCQ